MRFFVDNGTQVGWAARHKYTSHVPKSLPRQSSIHDATQKHPIWWWEKEERTGGEVRPPDSSIMEAGSWVANPTNGRRAIIYPLATSINFQALHTSYTPQPCPRPPWLYSWSRTAKTRHPLNITTAEAGMEGICADRKERRLR
jgi:hypothetical protein